MRHEEKDRERGMHLGGGARVILYRGGEVCEYEIDEKSGGSEAWTVIREEGKLVFCARHTRIERHNDRCVP